MTGNLLDLFLPPVRAWFEEGLSRPTPVQGSDETPIRRALQALLNHLSCFASRVAVETWNGEPVL